MATTPNMGMLLPIVSTTIGPLYAYENNQAFAVIDAHTHAPGNGVPIPTAGISINADLPINNYNISNIKSSQYASNGSPLSAPTDIRSVYVVGGDLYYNNGIGQQIQITAGAALNATTIGGIGGDYATSSASLFYTSFTSTFTFWSAVNMPAAIDAGPITIREITTSPFGITINSPAALSADYSIILPNALPVSTKILTLDNAGNIAAVYDADGTTIQIISNLIQIADNGVSNVKLAANAVTNDKILDGTIQEEKFAPSVYQPVEFLADGNYTVPDGVYSIYLIACGGGGGGGGGYNYGNGTSAGAGGSGGVMFEGRVRVNPGDVIPVTIGIGGAGGFYTATGSTGGTTTFGTLVSCSGGSGGLGYSPSSGGNPSTLAPGRNFAGNGGIGIYTGSGGVGGNTYLLDPQSVGGSGGGSVSGLNSTNGVGGGGGGAIGIGANGGNGTSGGSSAADNTGGGGGGGGTGGFNVQNTGGNGGSGYLAVYIL